MGLTGGAVMLPVGHVQRRGQEKALRWHHEHWQKIEDASMSLPIIRKIWVHNNVSLAVARGTESLWDCTIDLN